ncbi:MAG: hypothetical protein KA166_06305 [Saprospiraceae bacterium]|nr:hypothetical protein [Saprospiraceae bacterium]MBP8087006.1 hypothetical protein [Saprospiraceae bacterium]
MSHPTTNMAMKKFSILFIIYSYLYYDPETRHYLINNFISGVYRKCKPEDALKIIRKDIQTARFPGLSCRSKPHLDGKLILQQS